jgi:hypothetical protein
MEFFYAGILSLLSLASSNFKLKLLKSIDVPNFIYFEVLIGGVLELINEQLFLNGANAP